MNRVKELLIKYKDIISYGFFGVCATLINIAVYFLFYDIMRVPNVASAVTAWTAAFIFAYISNKLWVFESRSWEKKTFIREFLSFLSARLLTGFLDVEIMYIAVDLLDLNAVLWKILSNVIVIILNYFASKLIVFKKKT